MLIRLKIRFWKGLKVNRIKNVVAFPPTEKDFTKTLAC